MKTMNGWKAIHDISRTSACSMCLEYPANVEVFPRLKYSKLFFFEDIRDANQFASEFHNIKVVPCIAKNPSKSQLPLPEGRGLHSNV